MSESKQIFIEKRIVSNEIIPDRLFACFAEVSPEAVAALSRTYETGEKVPDTLADLHRRHIKYNHELGENDLIWEAGPSADSLYDLTVFSVGSIEMARMLRENDPFTQHGLFYDPDYFEWHIHTPLRKASPARREILRQLLEQSGMKM